MRNMMQKLKLTVNESQDARLPRAGRIVRLPGVHLRTLLLAADGPRLSGHAAVEEEGLTALP